MIPYLRAAVAATVLAVVMIGCVSTPRFTSTRSTTNTDYALTEEGIASYYAEDYNGHTTSSGETYDMQQLTAAHQTLPFDSRVKVTNLENGKSIVVRINDRGPFKDNRVIDLSFAAAKALEMIGSGTAKVRLEVLQLGEAR